MEMVASLPASTSANATPTFMGLPLGLARDRHPATFGLHDEVVSETRAHRAKAGDRAP